MSKEDKKIIKIMLICLSFAIAFACGVVYMEMYHPEIMKKISVVAVIAYAIITVLIVISKDGITVVLGLADPVTPSKSNRSVNRTPMEKSHKRLTADYVPGYDRVDDADDDASADNDSNSNEFRRPIGVMPTPWAGKGSFSDYYGHEYTNIGGTIYDDNGNFCPDYMRSYYGIPDDEDSQNDGW
ncbi:MAG: hypothetical protein IKE78_08850 [Erysipelotrichaceae bacterium]|nr:hypothetical protein [Erysipelotrichaceae bacterium]